MRAIVVRLVAVPVAAVPDADGQAARTGDAAIVEALLDPRVCRSGRHRCRFCMS